MNQKLYTKSFYVIGLIYCFCEMTNYIKYRLKLAKYNKIPHDNTKINNTFYDKINSFMDKDVNVVSLLYYSFYKTDICNIYSNNIMDFLSQGFFRKKLVQITFNEYLRIYDIFMKINKKLLEKNIHINIGYNDKITNIYNMDNKLITIYHPLSLKLLTKILKLMGHMSMIRNDFVYQSKKNINIYVYGKFRTTKKTIILLPGIGFGACVYKKFYNIIKKSSIISNYNIVTIEVKQISYSSSKITPLQDIFLEIIKELNALVIENEISGQDITIISHSYGTLIHSVLLSTDYLEKSKHVFCEPVCFIPSCTKITYFAFRETISISPLIINLFRYLFFRHINIQILFKDVHPANYLCDEVTLKKIDGLVILSGKDQFVESHEINDYIKKYIPNFDIIYKDKFLHGQVLFDSDNIHKIIGFISK